MIWCVIGLLYLSGDPISVRVCEYRTHGDCIAARQALYRVAFSNDRTGAMLICRSSMSGT